MQALTEFNSTTNCEQLGKVSLLRSRMSTIATLDSNPATFPLNQSIYADATHEVGITLTLMDQLLTNSKVVVLDAIAAFNLSAVFGSPPPLNKRSETTFIASQVVPFATNLIIQVLECSDMSPTKQMRFLL